MRCRLKISPPFLKKVTSMGCRKLLALMPTPVMPAFLVLANHVDVGRDGKVHAIAIPSGGAAYPCCSCNSAKIDCSISDTARRRVKETEAPDLDICVLDINSPTLGSGTRFLPSLLPNQSNV